MRVCGARARAFGPCERGARVSQILLSHKTVAGEEQGHFGEGRSGGQPPHDLYKAAD